MDNSKIYQTQQNYNCGLGAAKLNIYNGRLLYEYPVSTIGSGNYQIDVSLIYNAHYKSTNYNGKKIGFGNGWKLNIQQYVFQYDQSYNLDGFESSDYVYIDTNWCVHRFVKYKNNNLEGWSAYYDESGTGLKLVIYTDLDTGLIVSQEISDEYGNTYSFNEGKLVTFVSAINPSIEKIIEYDINDKDKILSIYDARKQTRRIGFDYNEAKLPKTIYNTITSIKYTFEYEENKLLEINKEKGDIKKKIHEFTYFTNDLMNNVINSEDLLALRFEYATRNNMQVVTKVATGTARKETICAKAYCNDSRYLGDNDYLVDISEKHEDYILSMPDNYVNSTDSYNYQTSFTELSNMKDLKIRYYFDVDGRSISNLEVTEESKHFTTYRPTGFEILGNGLSNIYLNGKATKAVSKMNNKYITTIDNNNLNNFLSIFDKHYTDKNGNKIYIEEYSDLFNISFWLMFNINNDSTLLATLKYVLSDGEHTEKVIIKNTLGQAWQMVSIPLKLVIIQKSLSNISISIDVDTELNINNDNIFITDVRINKGGIQEICIDSSTLGDDGYRVLKIDDRLYYCDDRERSEKLSPKFYLTQDDIDSTYKSIFKCMRKGLAWYDFFYCNKTKVKSVCSISLISRSNSSYSFTLEDHTDDNISNPDIPNYHFRMVDLVSINEDTKTYMVSEVQKRFHPLNATRYYYETKNAIGYVSDLNSEKRLPDDKATLSYVWENDDGTSKANKYTKKIYKNNGELDREIKLITENYYDEYGNLTKNETYDEENTNGEKLVSIYEYDEDKEYIIKAIKDGAISECSYDNDGNIDVITSKYSKKYLNNIVETIDTPITTNMISYNYDAFEELESIEFRDKDNNLINKNTLTTDKRGNLTGLKDQSNVSYDFVYNTFSELKSVYRNNDLLQKQQNIIGRNTDRNIMSLFQSNDNIYVTTSEYDKYGKIKLSETGKRNNQEIVNKVEIQFQYEQLNDQLSLSLERVKKVVDPYYQNNYRYEYDDSEGTTTIIDNKTNSKVITKPNQTKIYKIADDLKVIKNSIIREDQMNGNPKASYNYTKLLASGNIDDISPDAWQKNDFFSYDYEYDNLGRLKTKKGQEDKYTNTTIQINKEISYYDSTQLPKCINYNVNSKLNDNEANANLTYENSYLNGNITKVVTRGTRFLKNPKDDESLQTVSISPETNQYEYDSYNRLKKEIKPNNDTVEYIYGQTSNMVEQVKKNNSLIKSLQYESGRLTKVTNNGIIKQIAYDNYGNILQTDEATITYNSRNLMETYEKNNNEKYHFYYNYQGIRYKKAKESGNTVNYYLDGVRILGEDAVDINNVIIRKFRYFYDASGICGINYIIDDIDHYFNLIKDSLGNVSKVMYRGKIIGEYTYDAWGNCEVNILNDTNPNDIDKDIVKYNPFRYKGYYYDIETELYYCQTRYYNPSIYQWLSPDSIDYLDPESINGLNLYAYCGNNPVMLSDSSGCSPFWDSVGNWFKDNWQWVAGAAIIVGLGIAVIATGGAAAGVAGFILAGAFKGAVIGATSGALIGGVFGGLSGGDGWSWDGALNGAKNGFFTGALSGAIMGAATNAIKVGQAANMWASSSTKSSYAQMVNHYKDHVIVEGQKHLAKNIVSYTMQAKGFLAANSASAYTIGINTIKIAGAPGGIFTTTGLIKSFWYILPL